MPDLEISNLPAIAEAAVASADELALADGSASETKKVTVKDLVAAGVALIDDADIPAAKVAGPFAVNTVATATIQNDAVNADKLATDSVTSDAIAANAVGASELADNAVDSAAIATDAVITAKITDLNVTSDKLASNSVTTVKILDGNVTYAKLNLSDGDIPGAKLTSSSVTSSQLATNSVTATELADNAVDNGAIANLAVTGGKIAATTITGSNLVNNTITATQIADNVITATQIVANAVGASELADDAVDTDAIVDGAVTSAKIGSGSIAYAKLSIADGDIAGAKITSNSLTATQIAANAIGTSELADNAVDTAAIASGAVTSAEIATDTIVAGNIAANAITASELANNAVTSDKILNGAVTAAKLSGTLGSASIADDAIITAKIADDAVDSTKLAANAVDAAALADNAVDSGAIATSAVIEAKIASNAVTVTKIADGTITPAKLNTSNLDRSLNVASGNLGINNAVSGGAATRSGITYNAEGLITGTVALAASDLPKATTSAVGGISVGDGLSVTGAGALSITNSVTANTAGAVKVTYNAQGQITGSSTLAAGDIPTATTSAKGGVQITSGGGLTVDGSGNLTTSNSGVGAGIYQSVTVNAKGVVTAGAGLTESLIPSLSAAKITSGTIDAARIGTDSIDGTKLTNSSTALFQSVQQTGAYPTAQYNGQLLFDTVSEDCFIWDGNAWQAITTLTKGSLVFGGTFNATTSKMVSTTTSGIAAGLAVGSNLPTPSATTDGVYVVVSTSGTPSAPAPVVALAPPDYILGVTNTAGSSWNEVDLSQTVAGQVASNITFTPFGQLSSTNVQDAIQEVESEKLSKAGGTVTGEVLIGVNGSLVFEGTGSDDEFETRLTVANPTTSDKVITLPNITGTVITHNDTGTVTGTMLANDTIQNVDIKSDAAIAYSKLASVASGYLLVGNGASTSVAAAVAVTGDISINNAGLTSIASNVIVDADIKSDAAISGSKIVQGTTSVLGVLQLTDAVDSASTTTAATPAAVKLAKDAADAAQTTADAALPKDGSSLMTGHLQVDNDKEVRFFEADSNGSNYVGIKGATDKGDNGSYTLSLPAASPNTGQVLKAGSTATTLEWAADSATDNTKMPLAGGTFTGDVTFTGDSSNGLWDKSASAFVANLTGTASNNAVLTGSTNNTIATVTGANALQGEANLTFDGTDFTQKINSSTAYSATATPQKGFQIQNEDDTTNSFSALRLTSGSSSPATAQISSIRTGTGQNDLAFQLETGNNAFEAMRIDSSGRLLVGHATGNGSPQLSISGNTGGATGAGMIFLRRGLDTATIGGNTGADLGEIKFGDLDGGVYASIQGKTDAAAGSNDYPGRIIFATTADAASSPTERMRIDSSGHVLIGATSWSFPKTLNIESTTGDLLSLSSGGTTSGAADTGPNIEFKVHNGSALVGMAELNVLKENATSGNNASYMQFKTRPAGGSTITALTLNSSQNATFAGTVSDSKGDLRKIIKVDKTSAYVIVASDSGKAISITTGGVTVNASVMSGSEAVTIINHSGSDQTITQGSGMTMYNTADANSGNRVLAGRGMATIYYVGGDTSYISGAGLS